MATLPGLHVGLTLDSATFIAETRRVNSSIQRMGRDVRGQTAVIERSFVSAGAAARNFSRVIAGLGLIAGTQRLIRYADSFTQLQNQLQLVTTSTQNLGHVTNELFDIAGDTGQTIAATSQLFVRIARASKELGVSQGELLDVTRSLNQALVISGASSQEADAALRQLSQGLASGVLRGEEFNSIAEQMPILVDAIAKELGIASTEVRGFAKEGEITADVVIRAVQGMANEWETQFGGMNRTVSQALTHLDNEFGRLIGTTNNAAGGTSGLATAIDGLADAIGEADLTSLITLVSELNRWVDELTGGFADLGDVLSYNAPLLRLWIDEIAKLLGLTKAPDTSLEALAPPEVIDRIEKMTDAARLLAESTKADFKLPEAIDENLTKIALEIDELNRLTEAYKESEVAVRSVQVALLQEAAARDLAGKASAEQILQVQHEIRQREAARDSNEAAKKAAQEALQAAESIVTTRKAAVESLTLENAKLSDSVRFYGFYNESLSTIEAKIESVAQARELTAQGVDVEKAGIDKLIIANTNLAAQLELVTAARAAHAEGENLQLQIQHRGRETEELRVQIRLLETRQKFGEAGVAAVEAEVRAAERLRSELEQVNAARDLKDTLEQQQLVLRYGGQETQEYRVQLALLELKAKHGAAFAETQEDVVRAIERQRAATEAQQEALQEQQRLAERQADLMLEPFRNAISNVQNLMTDTFVEIFEGGIDSFEDLAGAIKDIFIRLAAEIATLMVIRPVLAGLPASLGGFAGAAGGIAGPGGLAGLASGAAGTAGAFSRMPTPAAGVPFVTRPGEAALVAPAAAGTNWGGIFVSGALGALGGSVLAPLLFKGRGQSGIGGTFGGGIGAAAGFGLGLGPAGALAGGLLGSIGGGFLGSLFGGDQEDTGAFRVSTGAGSPFDVGRFGSLNISGENSFAGPFREIVARFDEGVSEFLTGRQEQLATQAVQALAQFETRLPEADPSAGFLAALQERARAVLEAVLPDAADIEAIVGTAADIDQLGQRVGVALQAVQTFNELTGKTATPAQQLENALADVRRQFAELRPIARALGLDVNALAAAQHQALATTRQQFAIEQQRIALEKQALTLQLQSFTANNQLQRDLIVIRLQFIELGNAARAAGVPLALVGQAFRAAQAQARQADREQRQQAAAERRARQIARQERIEANRQQRLEDRTSLFSSLQRQASVGNPLANFRLDLQELQISFVEIRREARRLNIDMSLVNLAFRNQRDAIRNEFIAELQSGMNSLVDQAVEVRDRFQGLLDPLLDFQRELQGVGASPAQGFQLAQQDFDRISQLALGGNITAIEQIDEAGRALLDAAALFGASPLVADVRGQVSDVVARVIERTADVQNDAMRGVTSAIDRTGRETVTELRQLVAQGRENAAAIARQDRLLQQVVANTGSGRRTA